MGQLGNLSPQGSVVVGILVGLIATSVQSLGLTLQRKSHILEEEKDCSEYRRPPYRRRRWQLGIAMFIISNLGGSSIQITTLPLPVLSTLQASGLVFNSICATLILGEPFTRWSFGGTILVCGGAVLIAIFGAIPEPAHNLDQLLVLLERREFIIWMVGQAMLVSIIVIGAKSLKYVRRWSGNSPKMTLYRGMSYGAVSGILSAHCLLLAKSAVELLVRTIVDQHNQFDRWQSWIILLGLLFLALTQLYYLHRGLKLCSTSILYPFVFCVYNIIAILDGLIYFNQSSRLTLGHGLLIALGTLILLLGVLPLSWRLGNDPGSTRGPTVQAALLPGMEYIDDDSSSKIENSAVVDEESAVKSPSPFPASRHRLSFSDDPRTPTKKQEEVLSIKRVRRKGISETEEILEELEDEGDLLGDFASFTSHSRRSTQRLASPQTRSYQEPPTESTALLARSGTGRSYRDKRRRQSAPLLGRSGRERRRRSAGSQEALGGWWKMSWWRRESSGSKASGKGTGNAASRSTDPDVGTESQGRHDSA